MPKTKWEGAEDPNVVQKYYFVKDVDFFFKPMMEFNDDNNST